MFSVCSPGRSGVPPVLVLAEERGRWEGYSCTGPGQEAGRAYPYDLTAVSPGQDQDRECPPARTRTGSTPSLGPGQGVSPQPGPGEKIPSSRQHIP